MAEYYRARDEQVEAVRRIQALYHDRLDGIRIAVLCIDKAPTRKGQVVAAHVQKVPPKMVPLLDGEYDVMLVISDDYWQACPEKHDALIDHELCHVAEAFDGEFTLIGHDIEEFGAVIERHGFWRRDHGEASVQQALFAMPRGETKITAGLKTA